MAGPEACRISGLLELPGSATYYETAPLAGTKRQNDETDEEDAPWEYDSNFPDTQAQHTFQENEQQFDNDIINNKEMQSDVVPPSKKRMTKTEETTKATTTTKRTKGAQKVIKKNQTRMTGNGLEVEIAGRWEPAIYHNEYVKMFSHQLFGPQYTYGRASGEGKEYDKTSYLEEQRDWARAREHRPAILFELEKPANKYPRTNPPPIVCEISNVRRVIIDVINNKPLRDFPFLPDAISTEAEGWLQEAWFRMDPGLEMEDLIQRMPYTAEDDPYGGRKIFNRSVRRRELFRKDGRCLAWNRINKNTLWDIKLKEQVEASPDSANPNSTSHLQDLTATETLALKDATYMSGKHLTRGNNRSLRGDRRKQRDQEVAEREAARAAKASKQRPQAKNDNDAAGVGPPQKKKLKQQPTETNRVSNATDVRHRLGGSPPMGNQSGSIVHHKNGTLGHPSSPNFEHERRQFPGAYQTYGRPEYASPATHVMRYSDESLVNKAVANYQLVPGLGSQVYNQVRLSPQDISVPEEQDLAKNQRRFQQTQYLCNSNGVGNNFETVTGKTQTSTAASIMSPATPPPANSPLAGGQMSNQPRSQSYPADPYPLHNYYSHGFHSRSSIIRPNLHQSYGGTDVRSLSSPILPSISQGWNTRNSWPNYPQRYQFSAASNHQYLPMQQQHHPTNYLDDNGDFWNSSNLEFQENAYSN